MAWGSEPHRHENLEPSPNLPLLDCGRGSYQGAYHGFRQLRTVIPKQAGDIAWEESHRGHLLLRAQGTAASWLYWGC